jgi:hypothetical protein
MIALDFFGKTLEETNCPLCNLPASEMILEDSVYRCHSNHQCEFRAYFSQKGNLTNFSLINNGYSLTFNDSGWCYMGRLNKEEQWWSHTNLGDHMVEVNLKDWSEKDFKMMLVFS